jgi:hypothetical protein
MGTGELARAHSLLERSLALSQDLNNPGQAAYILHSMANLAHLEGNLVRARELYERVAEQQRRLGMITLRSVLADLGCVLIRLGELDRGNDILKESLSLHRKVGEITSLVVEVFAYLANARGQPRRAVCLLGASEALARNTGRQIDTYLRSDHERNLASLRTQLDQAAFETAWAKGQALTVEQVVELALSDQLEGTGWLTAVPGQGPII